MASNSDFELDYHVTFPTAAFSVTEEDNSAAKVTTPDPENEPVVVLLGWLGCQEKHLAKYGEIYNKKRCITIQYSASGSQIFSSNREDNMETIGYKVLELLTDLSLDDNPILFHVFSNGGGMVYHQISRLLCSGTVEEFRHMDVIGCIFDSCPSERSIFVATKAFVATLKQPAWLSYIMGGFFFLYMLSMMLIRHVRSFFKAGSMCETGDYWNYMLNEPSRWPQMYLYSKSDKIVNYKYIDSVIAHRKKLRVDVTAHCWEDSEHVAHMRKHRESYINLCTSFLQRCLDKEH